MLRLPLLIISLTLLLASCASERTPDRTTAQTKERTVEVAPTYISLGDSLAVGVGASDPRERGFAALYRDLLRRETGGEVRFVQLGVSGETSESFIGSYPDAAESQLARAESAVSDRPNLRVTISLGGNDLLRTAGLADGERVAALDAYERNLRFALARLRAAAEPDARIAVLALYNPSPGTFTDRWVGELNRRTRTAAERYGASVAAADRAFRGEEDELTNWERYGDIHPTDAGYGVLAQEFADALSEESEGA